MSHYSVKTIALGLQPSYSLAALLLFAGSGACLITLFMPLVMWLKVISIIVIMLASAYYIAKDALLSLPWSFIAITLNAKGELVLSRKDGMEKRINVLAGSFVASYLTVLNFTYADSAWPRNLIVYHLILLRDNVDAEKFRQLRVWLRWGLNKKHEAHVEET